MMGNIETRLFKMYVGWHFIAGINRRYDPKYTHNFWGLKGILCSVTVGCNEHPVTFFLWQFFLSSKGQSTARKALEINWAPMRYYFYEY